MSVIIVDNHFDLVRAISSAWWNATSSCINYAGAGPGNRVNNTMKCIFPKLKYNMSLNSYIHYLHLKAFESYNMPIIACSKVLTCEFFVCSLKELSSLTDF